MFLMSSIDLTKKIGKDEHPVKDAIHVAILPVIVGPDLCVYPGRPAKVSSFNEEAGLFELGEIGKNIGIINPFMGGRADSGDRIYIFLYPNTVTSLRHDWEFEGLETIRKIGQPTLDGSKLYIENLAENLDMSYEDLMDAAEDFIDYGNYCNVGINEDASLPDEFWAHYELISGRIVPADKRYSFFSCSC